MNMSTAWKQLQQAKQVMDGLAVAVKKFNVPEVATSREVPYFNTQVFTFQNTATTRDMKEVSKTFFNNTSQLIRLTGLSYEVYTEFMDGLGLNLRAIPLSAGVFSTSPIVANIPTFDFEWNFRQERTMRQYANSYLDREILGNPDKGESLVFPCDLELESQDAITIMVRPTVLPILSQPAPVSPGFFVIDTISLYVTFSGYRVQR